MNIKKSSITVLSLVFGVSVILNIFDVPIAIPPSHVIPTIVVPTLINTPVPTTQNSVSSDIIKRYSAIVNYFPEGKNESISVSLTLNSSIITEVTTVHSKNDGKSRMYQTAFESEIQPHVVGKDINTLNITRIAGASFTTDAFLQAVQKIKNSI